MEAGKLICPMLRERCSTGKNPPLEQLHSSETSVAQLPGENYPSEDSLLIPQRDFNLYLMGVFLYYFKSLIMKQSADVPSRLALTLGLMLNTLLLVYRRNPQPFRVSKTLLWNSQQASHDVSL